MSPGRLVVRGGASLLLPGLWLVFGFAFTRGKFQLFTPFFLLLLLAITRSKKKKKKRKVHVLLLLRDRVARDGARAGVLWFWLAAVVSRKACVLRG